MRITRVAALTSAITRSRPAALRRDGLGARRAKAAARAPGRRGLADERAAGRARMRYRPPRRQAGAQMPRKRAAAAHGVQPPRLPAKLNPAREPVALGDDATFDADVF